MNHCVQWRRLLRYAVVLSICLLNLGLAKGQTQPKNKIEVISSDIGRLNRLKSGDEQELVGNVVLRQGETYIFCDSAHILNNQVNAFGNVSIVQHDSLKIFSNKLTYNGDKRLAYLLGNVVLDNNGKQLFTETLEYDLSSKVATYATGGLLRDGDTQLKSRRGIYFVETNDAFFKTKVEVINPEFSLKSDTLQFNTKTSLVTFLAPTRIAFQQGKVIYTEAGNYKVDTREAVFSKNPQYKSEKEIAKAQVIRYDDRIGKIRLEGNAYYEGDNQFAKADTIQYNQANGLIDLSGRGKFRTDKLNAAGDKLQYNAKTKSFKTFARTRIIEGATTLEADDMDYTSETGLGYAKGNVYYSDTLSAYTLRCDYADYDKSRGYMKAFGRRPVFIYKIDQDSLYIAADTFVTIRQPKVEAIDSLSQDSTQLESKVVKTKPIKEKTKPDKKKEAKASNKEMPAEEPEMLDLPEGKDSASLFTGAANQDSVFQEKDQNISTDSITKFYAYHNVQLYKNDFQAVCDSLAFSSLDSTFTFIGIPVIWSDSTQLSGDTIHMQLRDKKPDHLTLVDNALIITTEDEVYFNQIRGKEVIAYFSEGSISLMDIKGNAETVYYGLDNSKAYTGVNQSACSSMKIEFDEGKVRNVRFYTNPSNIYSPMGKIDHVKIRLKGFKWDIKRRPPDKESLMNPWLFYIPPPNVLAPKVEAPIAKPNGKKGKSKLWKN
ncbi:MAG: OstA-like protein [Saprospiraceae bacterium]